MYFHGLTGGVGSNFSFLVHTGLMWGHSSPRVNASVLRVEVYVFYENDTFRIVFSRIVSHGPAGGGCRSFGDSAKTESCAMCAEFSVNRSLGPPPFSLSVCRFSVTDRPQRGRRRPTKSFEQRLGAGKQKSRRSITRRCSRTAGQRCCWRNTRGIFFFFYILSLFFI